MTYVPIMKETTLLRKHWRDAWSLRADGSMFVRNRKTGKVIQIGAIDHGKEDAS